MYFSNDFTTLKKEESPIIPIIGTKNLKVIIKYGTYQFNI